MENEDFIAILISAKPMLMKYALYLTGDKENAKELWQETVVYAYMGRSKFIEGTKIVNWLSVIMRNRYFNTILKKRNAVSYIEYMATVRQIENDTPEEQLMVYDIQKYINSMPQELKEPIRLRILGLSYIEIANVLELPISTIKNRLFVAKKKIRELLNK